MFGVEFYFKAFAACVCLVFALVVRGRQPREAVVHYLAAFFLLIAGNQAAEAMRVAVSDPQVAAFWWRIATVCAALDPAVLFYLVTLHPRHPRLNRWRFVAPVWLAGGLLALATGFGPLASGGPASSHLLNALLIVFTAVTYLAVVFVAIGRAASEPTGFWHLLLPATILAVLPVTPQVPNHVLPVLEGLAGRKLIFEPGLILCQLMVLLAASSIIVFYASRVWLSGRRRVAIIVALAGAFTLVLNVRQIAFNLDRVGFDIDYARLHPVGQAAASLRWLVFGALASGALLRGDAIGLSLGLRRRAARVLIGVFLVGAGGLSVLIVAGTRGESSWFFSVLGGALIAVVVLSRGARDGLGYLAHRIYGLEPPGSLRFRQAAYLSALESVEVREDPVVARAELSRLRVELELDSSIAATLERVSRDTRPWDLRPGNSVGRAYRILSEGSRGPMGRTFPAEDERTRAPVQILEFRDDGDPSYAASLARFREVSRLNHPAISSPVEVLHSPIGALVIQPPEGCTLSSQAATTCVWTAPQAHRFIDTLLDGLVVAHANGVVHGSISSETVGVQADGSALIRGWIVPTIPVNATMQVGAAYKRTNAAPSAPVVPAAHDDVCAVSALARRLLPLPVPIKCEAILRRAEIADPEGRWPSAQAMQDAWRDASPDSSGA